MTLIDNQQTATDLVAATIQRTYNDATQTHLDRQAASNIIAALRSAGWASLNEVAVLIEAAGGSITVPDRLMQDGRDRRVTVQDDYANNGRRFTVTVHTR